MKQEKMYEMKKVRKNMLMTQTLKSIIHFVTQD